MTEYMFMIIYFIILCLEFKLIFNDKWLKIIFGTFGFCINFFAIRLIYISTFALIHKIPVFNIIQNNNALINITILTFLTSIVYICVFLSLFRVDYMNMIITDKNNLKFSLSIFTSLYLFLFLNTYFLYKEVNMPSINILNIKVGICAMLGFFLTLLYSYILGKLQLYAVKAESIQKELEQDEIVLKRLENEANYDYFTSCLKREVIYNKIDNILEGTPFFCVVFVDIDGLKITNDVYGHDEGDFYIKAVSKILIDEFVGKDIGRIGGDEFLIVLEHTDIYATMKCIIRCYEKVNNISKMFNKPYKTSISYGVVDIMPDNKFSRDEIIKLADTHMYNFKKSRKKNRK
ncbi:GGDEF domain-containing protein [[Clostridium] colinum]|uniref:GGDEF domain-containing protein n=1 Tax=[Clostridium] colinum TaxID=36835 RepID=UPI0020257F8C|nr:GGDEF domain-containing protein [[Clostridium] colinum]